MYNSPELYLLAFGPLRKVFSAQELNSIMDTMVERGIRLRRSLERIQDGHDSDTWSGEEDEIEHNAQELRRLKPY